MARALVFFLVLSLILLSAGASVVVSESNSSKSREVFRTTGVPTTSVTFRYCREIGSGEIRRLFSLSKAGELTKGLSLEFPLSCENANSTAREKWAYVKYSVPKSASSLGVSYKGRIVFNYDGSSAGLSQEPFVSNLSGTISSFEAIPLVGKFVSGAPLPVEGYLDYPFITLKSGDNFLSIETREGIVYGFALRTEKLVKDVLDYYPFLPENSTDYLVFAADKGGLECAIGSYYQDSLVIFGKTDIEGECITNAGNYLIFERGKLVEGWAYSLIKARDYKDNYPQNFAFRWGVPSEKFEENLVIIRRKPGFFEGVFSFFRGLFSGGK